MNKMNKKGFTLIEMLVVIAIIAVLVSIIIPVVSSSTEKAAAATNAANLRSLKAEAVTASLTKLTTTANLTLEYDDEGNLKTVTPTSTAPKSEGCTGCSANVAAEFSIDASGGIVATYDGMTIADFAAIAGGETTAAEG